MPNIKSAKKRVLVTEKKTKENKMIKSALKTSIKKFLAAVEAGDKETANALYPETVSAIGTVGLTMALTSIISPVSKFILILLMYLGRVGILTFAFALRRSKKSEAAVRRPVDNVFIG